MRHATQQRGIEPRIAHNYKVIAETTTMYFINKDAAITTRNSFANIGVKAWVMIHLSNGSYIPLNEG